MAFGRNAKAAQDESVAIGAGSETARTKQIMLGKSTTEVTVANLANQSQSQNAIVVANQDGTLQRVEVGGQIFDNLKCTGSGTNAVCYGPGATASAVNSTAIGAGTTSSSGGAAAFGFGSTASGEKSFALGFEAQATGIASIAIGNQTQSLHGATVAIGNQATSSQSGAVAIGGETRDNLWQRLFWLAVILWQTLACGL